jgi:hypothetical protein
MFSLKNSAKVARLRVLMRRQVRTGSVGFLYTLEVTNRRVSAAQDANQDYVEQQRLGA